MNQTQPQIGPHLVCVTHSPAFLPQARSLLDTIEGLAATPKGIGPDTTILFGWAVLRLTPEEGCLRVKHRDYRSPSQPDVDLMDDVFGALTQQVEMLGRLGVEPLASS